jgi:hypothetical protein
VNKSVQGNNSSELGLDAIAKAFEQISRTDISRSRPEEPEFREARPAESSSASPGAVSSERRPAFGKVALPGFIALAVVVCVSAIVLAWPMPGGHTAKSDPVPPAAPGSFSAVAGEKQPVTTQAISAMAPAKSAKSPEQPTVRQIASEPAVPAAPDTTPRIQALERRLINLEQGIEQIKSDQANLARENSDLLGSLKEAQERLGLRVLEFASNAKAAEENAARDRLTAAEQLRGNQEQMVKIAEQLKAGQDQIEQMKGAAPRRISKFASPQPQAANGPTAATPKPAPMMPPKQSATLPAQSSRQPQTR